MAEKVGFIGLGNIGNPMSRNVLKAGFPLVAYDVNPAAIGRLVKEGAIGQNIFHMGKIGAGHMTKALNNFLSAANYLAASEALTVATKCGLDPAKVVGAVNASSGMSFATMKRIPNFVLKGDFSFRGGMATELIIKGLTTALSIGKEAGVPMLFAALAQQLYQLAQSLQGPQAPNQSAIKLYENWAGVENRSK
jgi:3-hydroxyisobutyrate dehydrogenase